MRDCDGNKLLIGDTVKRISGEHENMKKGETAVIRDFNKDSIHIYLEGYRTGHGVSHFVKEKEENEI